MKIAMAMLGVAAVLGAGTASAREGDARIRQRIIRQSIAAYPGSCACPYSVARNGSSCGRRSAWSRGGGYAPKCYARDVTAADLRDAR